PITESIAVPEPSRFAPASGRTRDDPSGPTACTGTGPAQARDRPSSPLRNAWARTPPVARPLAGNSEKNDTLTRPGSVPGSAADVTETVATTFSASGSIDPKKRM